MKFLQQKITSLDTKADPEFIILKLEPGNETHFGARTVTLLKKIGQASIHVLAFARGQKLMMNMTRMLCNGKKSMKVAGFIREMFSMGFDRKTLFEPKCPIEEVSAKAESYN